jgi:sugar lactone lactonase YvrE
MRTLNSQISMRKSLLNMAIGAAVLASNVAMAGDIHFTADQLYAESLTWSSQQHVFMVGSVKHGTVGKVGPDGKYTPFIQDKRLISTLGLLVDDKRNVLWVTNSDPGAGDRSAEATRGKLAAVATFNATTGKPLAYYDLSKLDPGAHLANDLVLDAAGNAYVTDSFSPVIYRVDTHGHASVFARDPRFKTGDGFNLNGIAIHQDYLLVGNYNSGKFFRVDLKDPSKVELVDIPEAIKGADGLHLIDGQHLVVVQNAGADEIVELLSKDDWRTAQIVRRKKSEASMPSAAVDADGKIYVLNSRIDTLFKQDAPKVSDFILQQF